MLTQNSPELTVQFQLLYTMTKKDAYTGVLLIRCLRRVLCWMVMYLVNDGKSAYATQSNTASPCANTRQRGLQNIGSTAYAVGSAKEFPRTHDVGHSKKKKTMLYWAQPRFPAPGIGFEDLAYLTWQTLIPGRRKIQHLDVGSELPHNLNCEISSVLLSVFE